MSGGRFEYKQFWISEIANQISEDLKRQGEKKSKSELYSDQEYYEKYQEEKYYSIYPTEVQNKMREAVKILSLAAIYAQRVDYFLSGDDGDESFITRLDEEIKKFNKSWKKEKPKIKRQKTKFK